MIKLIVPAKICIPIALMVGVAVAGNAQQPRITDKDDIEPSSCLTGATIQIRAIPAEIRLGQPSIVRWSVAIPPGCGGLHTYLNGSPVAATGDRSVSPSAFAVFTITASMTRLGVHQERSASASIRVTYPERVVINPSTPDPVAVLLAALASENKKQVIELCDVELDLTGYTNIEIRDGRSLIASPLCARGPRKYGPRIFVTDARSDKPLFSVRGDDVIISGFRLEGPTSGVGSGDRKEKGIVIWPYDGREPIHSIEISNMDISHWAGLGVQVTDNSVLMERGRLFNTNEAAVRIVDNFFHHNRHAEQGYGAEVAAGGYALIARNVFDQNRHAIAGGSRDLHNAKDYSGYTARDNLILTGGGYACTHHWLFRLLAPGFTRFCWHTHQIDMHGDDNRLYGHHNWQCGRAGETMIIQRNTILYTKGYAIKIRGNPADKAVVDGNVFSHEHHKDAIAQNGACGWGDNISNPIDVRPNNVFHADPAGALGKCDFVGDGELDDFMATGVTWWARSPITSQWRYLNTMSEQLRDVSLQRVDADGVCDVTPKRLVTEMAPQTYSKSGTGPWVPVLSVHPE